MNDMEKCPAPPVLVVATVTPSNVIVTEEPPAKPEPDTVTLEPAAPLVGLRVIEGVMVKVAVAELEPPPAAVTMWAPPTASIDELGTLKNVENDPLLSVLAVATVDEPNVMVTEWEFWKPVPEIETSEPSVPLIGFNKIEEVTMKPVEAESEAASVAMIVFPPFLEAGTVKVAVKEPELEVVMVGGEVDCTIPL